MNILVTEVTIIQLLYVHYHPCDVSSNNLESGSISETVDTPLNKSLTSASSLPKIKRV